MKLYLTIQLLYQLKQCILLPHLCLNTAATIAIVCISVMAMLVLVMLIGTMVVVLYRNHRTSQESEYKKSSAGQVIYETVIAQTVSDLRLDFTLNSKHGDI